MRSYGQYCAVAKALDVIGDRWNLLIVRELLLRGPIRYTDIQRGLPGIASNLLAERLRDLEEAGIVGKEAAPPPVATTLFELTDSGAELGSVIAALGKWGARFMADPTGDEVFMSHWLAFPVSLYLFDQPPSEPPVSIEVRAADEPVVIETVEGRVRTRLGTAADPDLVLEGPAPLVLGVISGQLPVGDARALGLETIGDLKALARLRTEVRSERPDDESFSDDARVLAGRVHAVRSRASGAVAR